MIRKILSTALVSAAIVVGGPALAAPGGGGGGGGGHGGHGGGIGANAGAHGGMSGGMGAGMGGMRGGMSGGLGAGAGIDIGGQATRINSQSTTRASPNASFNRGTATTTTNTRISGSNKTRVTTSSLPGLTAGATVHTSAGATLGTVSRVVTDRNGNILQVFVTTSTGQTLRLAPTALSMNGSILVASNVSTRAVNSQGVFNASPNGIAHASPNSVLNRGSVSASALAGLTTGLSVTNANGTNIGTISRVVTDSAGNIRLVLVTNTTTGATFRLMPSTLTINGTAVTTTSTAGG